MKVLALTINGKIEQCNLSVNKLCNHILHQSPEETSEEFAIRAAPNAAFADVTSKFGELNEEIPEKLIKEGLVALKLMDVLNYFDGKNKDLLEECFVLCDEINMYFLKPEFKTERGEEIEYIVNSRNESGLEDGIVGIYGPKSISVARYCIDNHISIKNFFTDGKLNGCSDIKSIQRKMKNVKL